MTAYVKPSWFFGVFVSNINVFNELDIIFTNFPPWSRTWDLSLAVALLVGENMRIPVLYL
jgi:hypothetical protein